MSTFKAQTGVAAGILVVAVLAIGVLHFSGGEIPGLQTKDTSLVTGFEGAKPGSADKCSPESGRYLKSADCSNHKLAKHRVTGASIKCGNDCIEKSTAYEVIAPNEKAIVSCYICNRPSCEGKYYKEEEAYCKTRNPANHGFACNEERIVVPKTPGASTPAAQGKPCIIAKQKCPPITEGFPDLEKEKDYVEYFVQGKTDDVNAVPANGRDLMACIADFGVENCKLVFDVDDVPCYKAKSVCFQAGGFASLGDCNKHCKNPSGSVITNLCEKYQYSAAGSDKSTECVRCNGETYNMGTRK